MSTQAVNPFDTPLPSEVQDHQQASAKTVASGGNPFDDLLPSEKADQQATTSGAIVPNARIRNLPNPAEGMTPSQALTNGVKTGAELAAVPASMIGLGEAADPVVTAVVSHLGKVKAILDAAGKMGLTSGGIGMGIKEARDLYKEFSSKEK